MLREYYMLKRDLSSLKEVMHVEAGLDHTHTEEKRGLIAHTRRRCYTLKRDLIDHTHTRRRCYTLKDLIIVQGGRGLSGT